MLNENNIVSIILGLLSGGILGYVFNYKKNKQETTTVKVENDTRYVEVYQTVINDLESKIKKLNVNVDELMLTIEDLRKKYLHLNEQYLDKKHMNMQLNLKIKNLETQLNELENKVK